MLKYLSLLFPLLLIGCSSVSSLHRPNDYYNPEQANSTNEPLFSDTHQTVMDNDIERILSHRLKLPAKSRIAILKLANDNYWDRYSDDIALLSKSISTEFIGRLRNSPRVYDASFLPALLVPQKRTVALLREAAARYQADLLLAYRSKCYTFEKYKFIDPNETKAYCSVEVVLLDVRTGIVPFTVVSSNQFSARKHTEDTNFNETIKKVEMAAVGQSLKESAEKLVVFLENIETL